MAQATAPARKPRTKRKATVTPQPIWDISAWLNEHKLVERRPELQLQVLAAVAGVNLHFLGQPGVAKSYGLREWAKSVPGANYFELPMNEEIGTDEFYGPPDIPRLTNEGVLVRKFEHHAPWAHIAFIDELFRSNGVLQNALLPYMNVGERNVKLNGHLTRAPVLFVVSASNTLPDEDNLLARALMDRITLLHVVERIKVRDNFKELRRRAERSRLGELDGATDSRPTITVEQLSAAQEAAARVRLSEEFLDALAELRDGCEAEGLDVSDRRWGELEAICRANAFMSGRDLLNTEDLGQLAPGIIRKPEDLPVANRLIQPFKGTYEQAAAEYREEIDEVMAELDPVRPRIDALKPHEEDMDALKQAINAGRKMWAIEHRVRETLAKAEREQRDSTSLRDVAADIEAVKKWYAANGLPTQIGATV